MRAGWFKWRWAHVVRHGGRMMRLFDRGHKEEFRVADWLRAVGIDVLDYSERLMYHDASDSYVCIPWEDLPGFHNAWAECDDVSMDPVHIARATARGEGPSQWGFVHPDNQHHRGSADGKVLGLEKWFPEVEGHGYGLLECKTHNEKSFADVKKKGVLSSKMQHYNQMQMYMRRLRLKWALYIAVNKNTDEIYAEIVWLKEEVADFYTDRAIETISARHAPPRITEDPSWFECRFCDFREICHYGKEMQVSCRSCAYASAEPDGTWRCNLYNSTIPDNFILQACEAWEQLR